MSMSQDFSGQKLGHYELRERLGRGGMADVYRAFQPGLERFVAVKVMSDRLASDEEFVERFRREAQAVGQLRHTHIVNVFDFGIEGDVYYMVMEFIKGENLKAHITRHPHGMTFDDALRITSQIADALDYAHRAGMIHRDVKPANIMFVDDTLQHAILTDFGIAYIFSQPGLTASGAMVGTPAYLSPEIAAGQTADERADLYGLGIILYEMLTGRVPYEADTPLAVIMKHVNAPLPLPSEFGRDLPAAIEQIILKALMKDPADRYQSAAEMKAALDRARAQLAEGAAIAEDDDQTEKVVVNHAATLPVAARDDTRPAATPLSNGGRSGLLLGGGMIAVIVVIIAALLFVNGGRKPAVVPTDTAVPATQAAAVVTDTEPASTATDAATSTDVPTATEAPTTIPSPAPTEVAELPAEVVRLYDAGLLSGLTPLQDEIDTLLLTNQADVAQARLDRMLQDEPENIEALAARAMLLASIGDADLGLQDADRAIELAPESPLGYIARGDVLQNWALDDAEGSQAAIEQALAFDPQNPEALWRASLNHFDLDQPEAFFDTLARAEEQGAAGFRFVDFASEHLYYSEQYERALPYLERRLVVDPQDMYSLRLLTLDLLHLGRPDDAYAAVKAFPGVFAAPGDLSAAAYVAYRAGDVEQARDWAETARALSDDAYAATYLLGLISWDVDHNLEAAMGYFDQVERVDFYDEYLTIDLGHELNLDRARILMAAEEPRAALPALQHSLEILGPYPPTLEMMADAHLALGEVDPARDYLRQALENTADNPEEQQRLLNRIQELGAIERPARDHVDLLSGLTPLQDEIDRLLLDDRWDDAEARLAAVLRDNPADIEGLAARSMMRVMNDRLRLALLDANRVVELAPDSPLGYIVRSDVLNHMENHEEALAAAEQALVLDPANPEALWRASLEHAALGDWDVHLDLLNQAIDAGARGWRFANFAGEFLYYDNDYGRAQPYLEAWNRAQPQDINSVAFLAANLIQLDRVEDAYELVRNYPGREMPDVPEAGGWAAYVAYRAEDYDQARRWAGVSLARFSNPPNAHYVLGLVSWAADGDLDAALEHLDKVSRLPDFGDIFLDPDKGHQVDFDRGRILVEAGELDAAIESFRRALDRDPRPYMAEALADAYLAQEQPEAALENLHRALDMSENPEERVRLSQRIRDLEG